MHHEGYLQGDTLQLHVLAWIVIIHFFVWKHNSKAIQEAWKLQFAHQYYTYKILNYGLTTAASIPPC